MEVFSKKSVRFAAKVAVVGSTQEQDLKPAAVAGGPGPRRLHSPPPKDILGPNRPPQLPHEGAMPWPMNWHDGRPTPASLLALMSVHKQRHPPAVCGSARIPAGMLLCYGSAAADLCSLG